MWRISVSMLVLLRAVIVFWSTADAFIPQTKFISTTSASFSTSAVFVSNADKGKNNNGSSNDNEKGKGTAREDGKEESEEDFQRRMAVVRSLQMSFYGASAEQRSDDNSGETATATDVADGPPSFDVANGTIERLPLFRASWYELPGRSNVLILRDPIYTNMFERIFYTPNSSSSDEHSISPWVFGHLYTPKDQDDESSKETRKQVFKSKAKKKLSKPKLSSSKKNQVLSTWKEVSGLRAKTNLSSTSALGTLMYVRDYRRMRDGRILALVQAAETFVVENIRQTLPYAVVDARLLPDVEELKLSEKIMDSCGGGEEDLEYCLKADETTLAGPARTKAVLDSIREYNPYECDANQRLEGIPDKADLSILDITHKALSKVNMPYCPFSSFGFNASSTSTNLATPLTDVEAEQTPSLEFQLLRKGITKIPPSDPRFSYNAEAAFSSSSESRESWTTDELEYELWLVMDHFLNANKKEISPSLLALLPSDDRLPKPWPSDFSLKANGNTSEYPHRRRQRRLSYMAPYLLESILPIGAKGSTNKDLENSVRKCSSVGVDEVAIQELRALLLSIPSTRQRLRVALERFHQWRLYEECDEFA